MKNKKILFSVFTKVWSKKPIHELAQFVSGLGFDGIEFPLRSGYQVEPENAEKGLPELASQLKEYGLAITSVAGRAEERVFAACQAAGISLIRIMYDASIEKGYLVSETEMKKDIERFLPFCEKYGVKVGVQHHCGAMVNNSMEMLHLLEAYDPKYVGAIWDAAHSGLAGEEPEQGLDIVWKYLCLVNLKTAYYELRTGPEADEAKFARHFTTGRHGLCSWSRVVNYLNKRGYEGVICLPAEYSDVPNTEKYITEDIGYVKKMFGDIYGEAIYR